MNDHYRNFSAALGRTEDDANAVPDPARWFDASAFDGIEPPPREWVVPDMIPDRTVTLFGGDGGTGKSLAALQLAFAMVTQSRWLGRTINAGAAMFISAEDDRDELHRRLSDISAAAGVPLSDATGLTLRSLAGEDAVLASFDRRTGTMMTTPLLAEIEGRILFSRPKLLVLDTLADLFGGEENDRAQARQFIGLLRGMALRHGMAVLLLSHPSLSGMQSGSGTSGSTAWNNSVRSRLYLDRVKGEDGEEQDPDLRRLRVMKANYGRADLEVIVRWDSGAFAVEGSEGTLDRFAAAARADRIFLHLLTLHISQGRFVSASKGPTFAPAVLKDHPEAEGLSPHALRAAMERLLTAGRIAIEEYGRPSKRRSRIVVKGETI